MRQPTNKALRKNIIKLGIGMLLGEIFAKITGLDTLIDETLQNILRVQREEEAMSNYRYLLQGGR